jgi:hypothetical protein
MPKYLIDAEGFDSLVLRLNRNIAPESVVAVNRLGDGSRYEVLTVPKDVPEYDIRIDPGMTTS